MSFQELRQGEYRRCVFTSQCRRLQRTKLVKRNEQCEANAKDHQGDEEVAIGKDGFYGCTQGHRVPIDSRNGLASTYREYLCAVNAPGVQRQRLGGFAVCASQRSGASDTITFAMTLCPIEFRWSSGVALCAGLSLAVAGFAQAPPASLKQADADYRAGVAALGHNDLTTALADFEKVVKLAPSAEEGHSALGAVLVR